MMRRNKSSMTILHHLSLLILLSMALTMMDCLQHNPTLVATPGQAAADGKVRDERTTTTSYSSKPDEGEGEQEEAYDDDDEGDYENKDDEDDDDDDMEAFLNVCDEMLEEHEATMASYEPLMAELRQIEKTKAELERVKETQARIASNTQKVQDIIKQLNARQLKELQNKFLKVKQEELGRRQHLEKQGVATDDNDNDDNDDDDEDLPEFLTVKELDRVLDKIENSLQFRDDKLEEYITDIIDHEMEHMPIPDFSELDDHDLDDDDDDEVIAVSSGSCVSPADAVQTIHQTLMNYSNDVIGRTDHVVTDFLPSSSSSSGRATQAQKRRQGGRIVHEMTSATYNIADISSRSGSSSSSSSPALGESWLRRFIPEDWEDFVLPAGWEKWDTQLPLWLSHTLGSSGSSPLLGGSTTAVGAPPESILQTQVLPGACWPMQGTRGHVTIALPYTINLSAISIDHASRSLLDKEQAKSAPKRIRVIAYPPCEDEDVEEGEEPEYNCPGLSFDPRDPLHAMDLEYDIDKWITQTFDFNSNGQESTKKDEDPTCSADDEEEGSCRAPPSVRADPPLHAADPVAAVRIEVLENWGNPDYTCLYRVRVHGKRTKY